MRIIKNSLFTSIGYIPSVFAANNFNKRQKNVRDVGGCHRVDKTNNKIESIEINILILLIN